MGMNGIQFQEGMSLFDLFQHWGEEAQCEAAVEQARWPAGFCAVRAAARRPTVCRG
jgi:hypothetical protein